MLHLIWPHLRVQCVEELSAQRLGQLGLDALLLDVDCTLKSYRTETVSPEVAAWVAELRAAGIQLCLVSNGRGRRIHRLAEELAIPYVSLAMKPLPFGCRAAIRRLGADPARTAMVGDQLFADVLAGRMAGLFSILVRPIRPEEEPWWTRTKRPLERFLLRKTPPQPADPADSL